jgi:hypothetical protein
LLFQCTNKLRSSEHAFHFSGKCHHEPKYRSWDNIITANQHFQGRLQNCWKRIFIVMSVHQSVSSSVCRWPARKRQLGSYWSDFQENLNCIICRKSVRNIQAPLRQEYRYITWRTIHIITRWILVKMWNISAESSKEYQNTHCAVNNSFLTKAVHDIISKEGNQTLVAFLV